MKKIIYLFCSIIFIHLAFVHLANSEVPLREEIVISLDFKDASLKDILKVFSLQSGLNFIASEEIQDKKITLYLDKVPLKEAMDKLFKANNLIYELDEKARIFTVKPSGEPAVETITRIYTLKYASVSSSSLKEEMRNYLGGAQVAGGGSGKWKSEAEVGLTEAIKKVLTPNIGKLIEEPRTNSLIIVDVPSRFGLIEEIIKRLDVPVPQIMLEVEMLDVNKNKLERMGIKFGDITSYPSILSLTYIGPLRSTSFPLKSIKNLPSAFTEGTVSFASSPYQILLDLIKSQSDTKILARPRILTLNNEPAEIGITAKEAINLKREKDVDTGEVTYTYEREEVGVSLRIIPQVNLETAEITMFIVPEVSNTKASNISGVFDPERRFTKTLVKVKDGETIIIGGLIHRELNQTFTKLPILGDLPLLGVFFKHREVSRNKERELLIFITPRIIKDIGISEVSEHIPLEREQSFEEDFLRSRSINHFLNNFEKVR